MKTLKPEAATQKACLDLLAAERIWALRQNTGAAFIPASEGANGRKVKARVIKMHSAGPGLADILCTPRRKDWAEVFVVWIECKAPGEKQTPEQVTFEKDVRDAGHTYLVIDDIDQLKEWLITRGFMRGK